MSEIVIKEVNNGYNVVLIDSGKKSEYVFKSTETVTMLEWLGKLIEGKRVYVKC